MSINTKNTRYKYQKALKLQISFLSIVSVLSVAAIMYLPQQINASQDDACAQGYVDGFQDGKQLDTRTMEPPYSPRSNDPNYLNCYEKGLDDATLD